MPIYWYCMFSVRLVTHLVTTSHVNCLWVMYIEERITILINELDTSLPHCSVSDCSLSLSLSLFFSSPVWHYCVKSCHMECLVLQQFWFEGHLECHLPFYYVALFRSWEWLAFISIFYVPMLRGMFCKINKN